MNDSTYWSAPIRVTRWKLNTLFHQVLAVIAVYSIWVPIQEHSKTEAAFVWHIILCTVGLIPLAAQAIMLYASDNVWTQGLERKSRIIMHGCLMGLSIVLLTVGISVEIHRGNNVTDYRHFSSGHSITGLVCMILLVFAGLCGLCSKFSQSLKGFLRPVITKFIHNVLGQVTFIFGIISLCCGYYTEWFKFYTNDASRMAATIATVIICLWTLAHAIISAVKQVQAIMNVVRYQGVPIEVQGVNRPLSIIKLNNT